MGSRLRGWNLFQKDSKVCFFQNLQEEFQDFYTEKNDLVYCNNSCAVMDVLDHEHKTTEWRLFFDSSKTRMKSVLLHNGNKFPSVPLAYTTNMKEKYENLKILLEKIQYDKYCWTVCCDLKAIPLLTGLQRGYNNFCCFLCERDSRDKKNHYVKKEWPKRESLTNGQKNVVHPSLVNSYMIILPSLLLKLGLFKNIVRALDKNGDGFYCLKEKFPLVSNSKIKEGIFLGPQIRALIRDGKFEDLLSQIEKSAWKSFKSVVKKNFRKP